MKNLRNLFSGMLAVLAVLLLTGCGEKDNPVRTSLDVDTSTLTLSVGESAVRMAFSKAEDAAITYTSSKPAVATVDQFGKVTAMSEGSATITIEMAETKKSWYAAKTITYEVVVKNTSAGTPGASGGKTVDLLTLTGDYVAQNGDVLKGTLVKNVKISIAAGATVTLAGMNITGVDNPQYEWAGITCLGDATIILKDGSTNTVKGFKANYPGIQAGPTGKTLTIKGTGSLTASSYGGGAGIGGGYLIACGNIEIQGGTVTAKGGNNGAGIGSGVSASCGTITISGGTVSATGGEDAAGIGSGAGAGGSCGNIKITAGVTSVTATKGGGAGAPNSIGAGGYGGTCTSVTIEAGANVIQN
jgi:hypothetical protein